jgi:release factor glutamine methyltransferase
MVYQPEEDSRLIIRCLPKDIQGKHVLEIGCGSGVVSVEAARRGAKVVAVDIDPAAVRTTREAALDARVTVVACEGDLFEPVAGERFDLILCNPPYLPDDPSDPDLALDGGREGSEFIARFLEGASEHLAEEGSIILLYSSKTGEEEVLSNVEENGFTCRPLARQGVGFFEELVVVELQAAPDQKDEGFLAKGKRGIVSTMMRDDVKVLVKEHNPDAAVDTIAHEATMTKLLNEHGIGPHFISFSEGKLVREYVEGERIEDFLSHAIAEEARMIVHQTLAQCRTMDRIGINKFEMTNPYKHLLVRRKADGAVEVVMIDFERCRRTEKPKNVTQACQYFAKARLLDLFTKAGLFVDGERLKELGTKYKREGYDEGVFRELLAMF